MTQRSIIFTLPNATTATQIGSNWFEEVVKKAKDEGFDVKCLRGGDDTKENLEKALSDNPDAFLTGIGHGCYSEDTEILTENGWKKFYELNGERVATLNPKTDELEYQYPTAYIEDRFYGKMLLINGRSVNQLVTPNHWLYSSWLTQGGRNWSPFNFVKAENIGKKGVDRDPKTGRFISSGATTGWCLKFKRGANWNCTRTATFELPAVEKEHVLAGWHEKRKLPSRTIPPKHVNIEDWVRFFGIYLAEGSASIGNKKGEYIVSLTQVDDHKRDTIREWCETIGKQIGASFWEEKTNDYSKSIRCKNKQLYNYLKQFGHSGQKFIPAEIKALPPSLLRTLLESMAFGDGGLNSSSTSICYNTSSKRLADDIQEVAMKAGMGATVGESRRENQNTLYSISITSDNACVTKPWLQWIPYNGPVYCVEVPNHIVYVRREGKACWSGNSKTTYTGQNKKPMIVEGQNEGIVANHAWYPLSCEVGASLGKAVVRGGCPAFCGYDKKFVFSLSKRSGDGGRAAQGFKEANNAVPLTLIEGGDFDAAFKAAQAKFQEWIEKEKKEGKKRRVKWLIHDKQCMVAPATSDAYGDGNTKIKEAKMEKVEVNFELEKETQLYQVYGKVTEKATGNPIEGAKIDIREKDISATTDKNGNYKMPEGIESGEYTFKCVADGYKSKTKRVTIS